MQTLFGLPFWAIALIASAFVPFAARAWGATAERRVKERSVRLLAGLGSNAREARGAGTGEAQA